LLGIEFKLQLAQCDASSKVNMANKNLLDRYNCGPVKFTGSHDALYERHLTFDQVIPVESATARDKLEAAASSIRDVLSQRWLKTEKTYRERNVKRVYYLSLEFLLGRSLANNVTNLMLDPLWAEFCAERKIDPLEIIEQEPDAGLGNGGLGRLAACFIDSMATLGIPGMGSGLRYSTVFSDRHFAMAGSASSRITGSRIPTRGKSQDQTRQSKCGWLARLISEAEHCESSATGPRRSSGFLTTAR